MQTQKSRVANHLLGLQSSPQLQKTVNDFFILNDSRSVKEVLWILFITVMESDEVDSWTKQRRANVTYMYKELADFIEQLEKYASPV